MFKFLAGTIVGAVIGAFGIYWIVTSEWLTREIEDRNRKEAAAKGIEYTSTRRYDPGSFRPPYPTTPTPTDSQI